MIRQRVWQFAVALTAKVTKEDREFVAVWLNEKEQKLFYELSIPDQCHAIRTARTIERLLKDEDCDGRIARRVGLLHDIGRRKSDMGTSGKVLSVVLRTLFPLQSKCWGRKSRRAKGLRHILYIHYEHPRIGAEMLRAIGCATEAEIVLKHHEAPAANEPPELRLLRIADEEN